MKKHLIILSFIAYVIISSIFLYTQSTPLNSEVVAQNDEYQFAKIVAQNCPLLKLPTKITVFENVYFLLEESYYVKILDSSIDDFYYVEYIDIKGYVSKNNVVLVNEQLENPYLTDISFDIIKNCKLCSLPQNIEKNFLEELTPQNNIFYYGKINGVDINQTSGNVWYFCKIFNNEKQITGYIHSTYTNNLSPIQTNLNSTTIKTSQNINNILSLPLKTQAIIILTISFPILLVVFLFLKGYKNT